MNYNEWMDSLELGNKVNYFKSRNTKVPEEVEVMHITEHGSIVLSNGVTFMRNVVEKEGKDDHVFFKGKTSGDIIRAL
jgi:hypothetical protein